MEILYFEKRNFLVPRSKKSMEGTFLAQKIIIIKNPAVKELYFRKWNFLGSGLKSSYIFLHFRRELAKPEKQEISYFSLKQVFSTFLDYC